MSIYIKYTNDNWVTEAKMTIPNPLLDRELLSVSKEIGQTLRGIDYSHKLFTKTRRLIRLSADQLNSSSQKAKMRAVWAAGALKYSPDDSTYVDVILEKDGDYSPDFIDDDENLEEFEFTIVYRSPN